MLNFKADIYLLSILFSCYLNWGLAIFLIHSNFRQQWFYYRSEPNTINSSNDLTLQFSWCYSIIAWDLTCCRYKTERY